MYFIVRRARFCHKKRVLFEVHICGMASVANRRTGVKHTKLVDIDVEATLGYLVRDRCVCVFAPFIPRHLSAPLGALVILAS